ncbi:MAG: hypothetical protein HQL87_14465 [Magnetococcales bacterium]|nr:hypothetical protein [Magnetococcales bacterium]
MAETMIKATCNKHSVSYYLPLHESSKFVALANISFAGRQKNGLTRGESLPNHAKIMLRRNQVDFAETRYPLRLSPIHFDQASLSCESSLLGSQQVIDTVLVS